MRRIYLIRHAMPTLPLGERWCIGSRTDLPLGKLGRIQAALLPFAGALPKNVPVFCSSLIRTRQTALPLCPEPMVAPGIQEQDMGLWDGLPFTEIMRRFPETYQAREADNAIAPEGAESMAAVAVRMRRGVLGCLQKTEGDILIVSHKSAISTLVGHRNELGYTSVSVLEAEGESFSVASWAQRDCPELTDAVCEAMLLAAGADAGRLAHCRAVAETADRLCALLMQRGLELDALSVHRAALLHDLAKGEPEHAAVGEAWLRELGYPELAALVGQHTEPDSAALNEAGLVFLADKAVRGDRPIPIGARFAASLAKCRTPEALAAHERRRLLAAALAAEVNALCGAEVVAL